MVGITSSGAHGSYTDKDFPGVVYRRPSPEPAGKRWKPVKIFGTRSQRKMTDEEMRRSGLHQRGEMHQFDENPEGKDFIVRQRLVDIEPAAPAAPAPAPEPAATEPAPAVSAPAPAPVILPSRRTTPQDTPQFGTESRLISSQRERARRSSTRRTRRPLLSQTPTLGPAGTLGV